MLPLNYFEKENARGAAAMGECTVLEAVAVLETWFGGRPRL
jgi:hypothetical protein